ncbi:MAG TPA: MFS transporter [Ideonella sp.]|uniref:MFS transporter n=1 Tax=Ideonella sp. TaxID=1929293 RepID=UPI002E35B410|nr:MFS transporter [Ideonella sp.]HEX5684489.1 MFS transporter [Ideonella sp.]
MSDTSRRRHAPLAWLTLCQGLFLTNNVTFMAINGLVGLALAPEGWMATLPLTAYVLGGALCTGLVARHQQRYGRQRAFQMGLAVAIVSSALCALAALIGSFWLLIAATVVAGYYNANAALYRFAAAELVGAEGRERAISWVLAGGILGGVVGPELAQATRDALAAPFAGAYAALVGVAALSMVALARIPFPALPPAPSGAAGRLPASVARQPAFIVAIAASALGYGVMNLLMAATPIAMQVCSHPFSAVAWVLEWHVLGMYVPSFFTGSLIRRVGVLPVLALGVLLNAACIALALHGVDLMHFTAALLMLGVGWNFLYIGGTTLYTQSYPASHRVRAQALMDRWVLGTMTLTSFFSGALVTTGGWQAMNLGALAPLALLALMLVWLRARPAPAPAGAPGSIET